MTLNLNELGAVSLGPADDPHGYWRATFLGGGMTSSTSFYFPDEPEANAQDPVLALLAPAERATLVAVADDGCLRFDIRLQGAGPTTFFAV